MSTPPETIRMVHTDIRAPSPPGAEARLPNDDLINAPSHYRGASGIQSIDITEAYRLGPHLTQAVDYLLRAGRKTADPCQDLAKAAWYCRRAAERRIDLVFGEPLDEHRPKPSRILADFDIREPHRALALAELLAPFPKPERLAVAAGLLDRAAESWTLAHLPSAHGGSAA